MKHLLQIALLTLAFSLDSKAGEEILTAVIKSPSAEGYINTGRGLEKVKFDVVNGRAIIEGDIVLGPASALLGDKGLVVRLPARLWPNRTMPYVIDQTVPNSQKILAAMSHWRERVGIVFVERTASNAALYPNYVRLSNQRNDVCASMVGMQQGEQLIELAEGCTTGAIIHEIGHALGLAHEHTRADRDSFVKVYFDRIISGKEHNFQVRLDVYNDSGAYDHRSIMHYGADAFSRDGRPTILPLGNEPIGQRAALSEGDVKAALLLYPLPTAKPVCVTLLMLNQPFWEGIGDIDATVSISGKIVFDGLLPYQGPLGEPRFKIAKFWAGKGFHSIDIATRRGQASISSSVEFRTDTEALNIAFWGQQDNRPKRFFSLNQDHYRDDIDDDVSCTTASPTANKEQIPEKQDLVPLASPDAPGSNWPSSTSSTIQFEDLTIPANTIHRIPLGVNEYRIRHLSVGDGATIWLPYDKIRFNLISENSIIGEKVQIKATGRSGDGGRDGSVNGNAGADGAAGGNAPTLLFDVGRASIGQKLRVYLSGGSGGTGGLGGSGRDGKNAKCVPPEDATNGGMGGAGGFAGHPGAGGFLFLKGRIEKPLEGLRVFVQGGLSDNQGGVGGPGGRGGAGASCGIFKFGPGRNGFDGANRHGTASGINEGPEGRVFDELVIGPIGR